MARFVLKIADGYFRIQVLEIVARFDLCVRTAALPRYGRTLDLSAIVGFPAYGLIRFSQGVLRKF